MEPLQAFKEFGFPGALLIMIFIGARVIFRWTAPRLEGWINRLVASHEALVSSATEIGKSNSETLRRQETVLAASTSAIHRMETTLQKLLQHFPKAVAGSSAESDSASPHPPLTPGA